jgi:hypothetical protein
MNPNHVEGEGDAQKKTTQKKREEIEEACFHNSRGTKKEGEVVERLESSSLEGRPHWNDLRPFALPGGQNGKRCDKNKLGIA